MKDELRKQSAVQWLLWTALILALLGSLRHVAHTFTSIDNNVAWGWVQAVAVDAGLFALALGITQRRRLRRSTRWLWVGVGLFSGISIYANLYYGLTFTLNTLPPWMVNTRPYVLAATLPILVLYLAEIVGSDVSYIVKKVEREQRRTEQATQVTEQPASIERARAVHAEMVSSEQDQRRRQVVDILVGAPDIGATELSRQLGVSRTTVYNDLEALTEEGTISKNGQGYRVHERR